MNLQHGHAAGRAAGARRRGTAGAAAAAEDGEVANSARF